MEKSRIYICNSLADEAKVKKLYNSFIEADEMPVIDGADLHRNIKNESRMGRFVFFRLGIEKHHKLVYVDGVPDTFNYGYLSSVEKENGKYFHRITLEIPYRPSVEITVQYVFITYKMPKQAVGASFFARYEIINASTL